ncbi:UNVERIFIED_CONTAM: hypothetical protein FKN15_021110 [Acipenser sinensis]
MLFGAKPQGAVTGFSLGMKPAGLGTIGTTAPPATTTITATAASTARYEVTFQKGIDCGGAYIKLLSHSNQLDLTQFHDTTPFSIMFGPDKCGEDDKLHFIFRHRNPLTGLYEEKHAKKPDVDLRDYYTDHKPHLYTLYLHPDNNYEILIDQSVVSKGSLLKDMTPPVTPPREIEDPADTKPDEWDDRIHIPDPTVQKPHDWDEDAPPQIPDPAAVRPPGWLAEEQPFIPDPDSEKPDDWEEEMDGEWEAPKIPNPACKDAVGCGKWTPPLVSNPAHKGKWKPPMIANPNYQGVWKARVIPNPRYFEDPNPFRMDPIGAVGLELWSLTPDLLFDNFLVCSEKSLADRWTAESWGQKQAAYDADAVRPCWGLIEDNNYEILIDQSVVSKGSLLKDMTPPVTPPREIEDPADTKPDEWDDRIHIPDPTVQKPHDWDEDAPPQIPDPAAVRPPGWLAEEQPFIPDPDSEKPDDWEEEMDGEWEAPKIPNPACKDAVGCGKWTPPLVSNPAHKGKWKPPMIANPNYQGVWKARVIPNPRYFEDPNPFRMDPIGAVGLELWSLTPDLLFDNFLVCSEKSLADRWTAESWGQKQAAYDADAPGVVLKLFAATEKRPWLWGVYVFTVALPVVLIISFCWPDKRFGPPDQDYFYKKTDDPQLDDSVDPEEGSKSSAQGKCYWGLTLCNLQRD